jgi:hypothetical protein
MKNKQRSPYNFDAKGYVLEVTLSTGDLLVYPYEIHENDRHLWEDEKDLFSTIRYLFFYGNNSCDCNLSKFIAWRDGFLAPIMKCGSHFYPTRVEAIRPDGTRVEIPKETEETTWEV